MSAHRLCHRRSDAVFLPTTNSRRRHEDRARCWFFLATSSAQQRASHHCETYIALVHPTTLWYSTCTPGVDGGTARVVQVYTVVQPLQYRQVVRHFQCGHILLHTRICGVQTLQTAQCILYTSRSFTFGGHVFAASVLVLTL